MMFSLWFCAALLEKVKTFSYYCPPCIHDHEDIKVIFQAKLWNFGN